MASNSSWKPYSSLTDAPTNLKEAIDWVLRVTGRDGKALNKETECICGLAAAVTDLLQSVQLEYHGYEGDGGDGKGPPKKRVTECLNELFSLVQGLGGTAVVRTYIDQLAQVLSALVGWSKIDKCYKGCDGGGNNNQHGKNSGCQYLKDVQKNDPCTECKCMKWKVDNPNNEGTPLGRKCTKCSDSGGVQHRCECGSGDCTPGKCKCAKEGKCCKCCCTSCTKCNKECSCVEDNDKGTYKGGHRIYKDTYQSAYGKMLFPSIYIDDYLAMKPVWTDLLERGGSMPPLPTPPPLCPNPPRLRKYHSSSPRWNNHILDGTGLDDGTLSQWLQALGFPKDMLNNSGPGNRWDAVIWDGFRGMLYLGFPDTGNGSDAHGIDNNDNTFRNPAGMNYAGYIHTVDRGAFCSNATIFHKNGTTSTTDENTNKCGALYKLYILSCAYFTGLQNKAPPQADNKTPKTIREILYWLSALPYSQAYPEVLKHGKDRLREVTQKPGDTASTTEQSELKFHQTGRNHPITVHEFNLFAHFQAVTQYCPLVLIGIQGGLKGTNSTKEPAIHSLYANTECSFTYPAVPIQAYNQVVHYIRGLFYQLYFLRKQCAVKVALGGKWRECRYGQGVVSHGVISWMCLGCNPMEHDRKSRVKKVNGELGKVVSKGNDTVADKVKALLEKIGDVVVQLGNAQEALEGKKTEAIEGVKGKLGKAKEGLDTAVKDGLDGKLDEAKKKLDELTGSGSGLIDSVTGGEGLEKATSKGEYDPGKNKISAAINGVREALEALQKEIQALKKKDVKEANQVLGDIIGVVIEDNEVENVIEQGISHEYTTLLQAIEKLKDICNSPKCSACDQHSSKCGQPSNPSICEKCLQPTTTGVPSPPPGIPRGQVTRF